MTSSWGRPSRFLRRLVVVVSIVGLLSGTVSAVIGSSAGAAGSGAPFYFGTLVTQPAHYRDEAAGGSKVAMLELGWRDYEPVEGQFNAHYAQEMRTKMEAFRAAGMQVTLGLGLHMTPNWVHSYPNSRFLSSSGSASADVNIVFNQVLRGKVERYFAQVDQDLGLENLWAIRLTSGGSPEILYPDGGKYWAFDPNARNGANMPPSMPRNPFPN